jgi:hypothetical protein
VFRANGSNFCAGFDLSALEEVRDADLLARFVRVEMLLQAVYFAEFDTVACAKGAAYGAGADLSRRAVIGSPIRARVSPCLVSSSALRWGLGVSQRLSAKPQPTKFSPQARRTMHCAPSNWGSRAGS